jgi:hypothetical protein
LTIFFDEFFDELFDKFFLSTNIQFSILAQFLKFKAFKSEDIDAIGIEVAQ